MQHSLQPPAPWLCGHRLIAGGFAQGITHSFARIGNALTPPLIAALVVVTSWRGSFFVLGAASLVWVLIWIWFFRDDPARHPSVSPAELATITAHGRRPKAPSVPWLPLFARMFPVTAVDFCYGWTLWLFLSWIPSFFFHNYNLDLQHSALYSAGVFAAGVIGDTVGGVLSDRLLHRSRNRGTARRNVIVAGMFGGLVFLLPVMLIHDLAIAALSLSLAFFCVELIVAPIWSVPMDIAPNYSGSASGMMNFGFGVAGIISPVIFGFLVDTTGSWTLPFGASVALLLVGAALAFRLHAERPFEFVPSTEPRLQAAQ